MPIEIESPEMMGYDSIKNNLTESSVFDANIADLEIDISKLVLAYGHHIGKPELCELVANSSSPFINDTNVLLTAGAATALFIINTTLLDTGDEIIVMHPNYGTNIETPRAIGCNVKLWSLTIENGFRPNIENLKKMVSSKTRLISITTPHNPTGIKISKSEILEIIEIAKSVDAYLLIDETYREIPFGEIDPSWVGEWDKIICVSSVSKAFGLPGLRIGWIITQDKKILNREYSIICVK